MLLTLIIIGWIVFIAMIILFNYGAHKNELDDDDLDNTRQLYPMDEYDEVIF